MRVSYRPRQELLRSFSRAWLDDDFARLTDEGTEAAVRRLVQEPRPGLFEFRLFSPLLLEGLLRELHGFDLWCRRRGIEPTRPNSMNEHGVMMDELGLDDAIDDLLDERLGVLTRVLFPTHAGDQLDHQHAFVVDYGEAGDRSLGFHVDDSEVTLNACLGLQFEGAEVYFRGERCDAHRQGPEPEEESWDWAPAPGMALLHAGAQRHGVHELRQGRRLNLIVWAKSTRHRRAHPRPHEGPAPWCPACAG